MAGISAFFVLCIQYFHYMLGSATGANWFLSMVQIVPKCSGNAQFELQICNISHGQENFVYLYGTLIEVQYNP